MAQGNSSNANRYKGEDIDADGDGSVNDAQTLQGKKPSDLKSEIGRNVSLSEYRSEVNRSVRNDAQQNFELGLIKIDYPDGFYDIFIDESKISSLSGGASFSGGGLSLLSFGNFSGSFDDTGNFSSDFKGGVHLTAKADLDDFEIKISSNTSGAENIYVVRKSDDTVLYENRRTFSAGDKFTIPQSLSSGTEYHIAFDSSGDWSPGENNTANLPEDGALFTLEGGVNGTDERSLSENTTVRVVSGIEGFVGGTSGSITSVVNNLGYSATKWTPTADYSLNGQSIDSLRLLDGSDGSEIASINESEIGTTIDISTNATSYQLEINLSSDGSDSPLIHSYEVGLDD